jgi:exodeoxyribonuclease VII small subunit
LTLGRGVAHSAAMDNPVESMTFEAALKELESIVARLESGETPLQDAIELYERGNALRARCAERLDAAQARIEAIRLDAEGRATTTPFTAG